MTNAFRRWLSASDSPHTRIATEEPGCGYIEEKRAMDGARRDSRQDAATERCSNIPAARLRAEANYPSNSIAMTIASSRPSLAG